MEERKAQIVQELRNIANDIRIKGLELITAGKVGHPGATLSSADLFAALYFNVLNVRPDEPKWEGRDRFILSKGHGCPPLYVALAIRGYYGMDELMRTYGTYNSRFQGHPDMKRTPGVDMTAGSLGQGLSAAVGMALAAKNDGKTHTVYCMLGDGECEEGQVWEAAMSAAHYKLDNLIAIVDRNKIQAKGPTCEIMEVEPLPDKWRAFGWEVIECDGHSIEEILDAFYAAKHTAVPGKPVVIIAHTIKGYGVSFMQNTCEWHTHAPNEEQLARAVAELTQEGGNGWWK